MAVEQEAAAHAKPGSEEQAAIQEQLERLLANPRFSHSRRFPSFLRFIVEKALSGETDMLKERTLGIEIFGRRAEYDTASDPIVRVTAGEIRKRIAQYYQEPGHEHELRIVLPTGSYVPQFHPPGASAESGAISAAGEDLPADRDGRGWRRWLSFAAALLIAAFIGGGGVLLWQRLHVAAPAPDFWTPVLNSGDPVLLCVADQNEYSDIALRDADAPNHQMTMHDNLTAVVIDDLNPIIHIAGILQSHGIKYSLRGEGATTLMDLRGGPTIFVGAFDNAWVLRLTRQLRYHFANNADMTKLGVVDSQDPNGHSWFVNRIQQMATNNYRDYAIVARFTDITTGELEIVVAGVARGGTIAAGEFLTNPSDHAQLQRIVDDAGAKKNLEVVLSTRIINGESGTARVEAVYYW